MIIICFFEIKSEVQNLQLFSDISTVFYSHSSIILYISVIKFDVFLFAYPVDPLN